MSRTKEKQRTAEVIERELVEVRARLEELRTELRGLHDAPGMTWGGASSDIRRPEPLESVIRFLFWGRTGQG